VAESYIKIEEMLLRFITCASLCLVFLSCSSQQINNGAYLKMAGRYQKVKGNELLILNDNKTFFCLRNYVQKSDVVTPLCDTLAIGVWNQRKTFITLKNNNDFNKVQYSILESELNSKDSIYFKIVLPQEDALDYNIFKFAIVTSPMYGQYNESSKPEFAIARKGDVMAFNFSIKNIAPNCDFGTKCYQRIYFNVFEGYKPLNKSSNFFTITLKNFNQCFYEAMDIDGEVVGIEGDSLFWRGNIYKKVK
jgi:hypothetical protein